MKKTLAVAAVLAAFAGSAMADVTVYGAIDLGLAWTHADDGTDTVAYKSGMDTASRVGFMATEKIGDVTVGAKFENSFDAMTGNEGASGFFNRETRLFVQTPYGEFAGGRFGALDSTTGPYNLAGSSIHATTGINDIGSTSAIFLGQNSRVGNTLVYKSPKFAGTQVYAQYASGDGKNTHETDRYYALGARYQQGPLMVTAIASVEDGADKDAVAAANGLYVPAAGGDAYAAATPNDTKDLTLKPAVAAAAATKGVETKAYTAAVSYDFGVTKAMFAAQYFDNVVHADYGTVDGYGMTVSAVTPVCGGSLKTQFGYMSAEDVADAAKEYKVWNVGALYYYNFSKRTSVYGGLGFTNKDLGASEVQTVNGAVGLIHNF